jgi:hypothetical protein
MEFMYSEKNKKLIVLFVINFYLNNTKNDKNNT